MRPFKAYADFLRMTWRNGGAALIWPVPAFAVSVLLISNSFVATAIAASLMWFCDIAYLKTAGRHIVEESSQSISDVAFTRFSAAAILFFIHIMAFGVVTIIIDIV